MTPPPSKQKTFIRVRYFLSAQGIFWIYTQIIIGIYNFFESLLYNLVFQKAVLSKNEEL